MRPTIWAVRRVEQNTKLDNSCSSSSSGSDEHLCWQQTMLLWIPEKWPTQSARGQRKVHEPPLRLLEYDEHKLYVSEHDWWYRGCTLLAQIHILMDKLASFLGCPCYHRQPMRIRRVTSWQSIIINQSLCILSWNARRNLREPSWLDTFFICLLVKHLRVET